MEHRKAGSPQLLEDGCADFLGFVERDVPDRKRLPTVRARECLVDEGFGEWVIFEALTEEGDVKPHRKARVL